jgi:flagellar motor switch protein FliG
MKLRVDKLSGPQKAAILFLTMGEEYSTTLFKSLDETSIKKIGKYMSEITYIPSDVLSAVMDEFLINFSSDSDVVISGEDFLKQVVNKSLDKEKAREVFKVIGEKGSSVPFSDLAYIPIENLINIIQGEHPQTIASVLSHIENEDGDLADMVRQKMFVFEDLLQIENRHFRDILQNVDNQLLIKALKTTSDEMKNKVFTNLSERASEMLKEDMEVMGPVKLSEVEEAQQEVIKIAKRLESEGRIVLAKGGDDVFV